MSSTKVDIRKLLSKLDFSIEGLAEASVEQAKLFERAAEYRTSCLRERLKAEAAYDLAKASRSLVLRHRAEAEGRKITEGLVGDSVTASRSVKESLALFIDAQVLDEYSKLLVDAFRMRRDSIRVLEDMTSNERRGAGAEAEAVTKLRAVKARLAKRYNKVEDL